MLSVVLRLGHSFDMKSAAFASPNVLHQKLSVVKAEGVIASTKESNKGHRHFLLATGFWRRTPSSSAILGAAAFLGGGAAS